VNQRKTGEYALISDAGGENCHAFVPYPLPPEPPLTVDKVLQVTMDHVLLALGRLDSISTLLPDTDLFLYMYIRKEAVLSSQIEGTQSSLSDLLLFEIEEAPGVPLDDVREVSNYVAAMDHGLSRLREGFPLSLRLIKEIHGVLLSKGRGSEKDPGEFRRTQNWVGGTRPGNALFVPPPANRVMECMGALEKFLHDEPMRMPLLTKAAMAHVQFETIHPFLDGNGRVGRLLITLLLCAEGVLSEPMLYLSLFFKAHRQEYYDLLQKVRTEGDWEGWVRFFMTGVKETSEVAVQTAKRLVQLFEKDRDMIHCLGKLTGSALRVHHALQQKPITSINRIKTMAGISVPTVTACLGAMQDLGIVEEVTGNKRGRIYRYSDYIKILSEGTEGAF